MSDQQDAGGRKCRQTGVSADGVSYHTCKESSYISLNYHRSRTSTKRRKSIWSIERPDECHTLCQAEIQNWRDKNGDYWSISKDAAVEFGSDGERMAFFDAPQNATDPWHGYPVGGKRGLPSVRLPPDYVIELWRTSKWVSYVTYSRLMAGKI